MAKVKLDKPKKKPAKAAEPVKAKPPTPEQLERRRRNVRLAVNAFALAVVVGGTAIGYRALAGHVAETYAVVERPPALVLTNRPAWMADDIAETLAAELAHALPPRGSTLDRDLLVRVEELAASDPWVQGVNAVRRARVEGRDTVLVDCDYRTPLAIVQSDDGKDFRLVSRDGVLLPPTYTARQARAVVTGRDATTNLRVILGVVVPPPDQVGRVWDAADLRAGLDVAALLHGRPGAGEVTAVDVGNFGQRRLRWTAGPEGRKAAQIRLWTRGGQEVYWGRPPASEDLLIEVPPDRKLDNLDAVARAFAGRAWPLWVDLRDDAVQYLDKPAEGR